MDERAEDRDLLGDADNVEMLGFCLTGYIALVALPSVVMDLIVNENEEQIQLIVSAG